MVRGAWGEGMLSQLNDVIPTQTVLRFWEGKIGKNLKFKGLKANKGTHFFARGNPK